MRQHIILFFSALLFLFACKEGSDTKDVIDQDIMTHLLVDVHIVDGSLAQQANSDSLFKNGTGRYLFLFKQYHTDSAQFKHSVKYYTTQPDILIKMYDNVNKLLQAKADSLNKLMTAERAIADKKQQEALKKTQKHQADSIAKATGKPQPKIAQPVVAPPRPIIIPQKTNFKNAYPH